MSKNKILKEISKLEEQIFLLELTNVWNSVSILKYRDLQNKLQRYYGMLEVFTCN